MKFSTWDIETEDWNKFKVASIYTYNKKIIICETIKEIVDNMIKLKGIFYSHYGGGFDNHFLIKYLRNNDFSMKWFNINSSLNKICVYYKNSNKKLFELRDSFTILPFSLRILAKEFTNKEKMDIDRSNIKGYSKEKINEYVASDSIILFEVIEKYLNLLNKNTIKCTISSECFTEHKKLYNHKKLRIPSVFDKFIRNSYAGARTEVFKRYGKNLHYYDFKSMYPSILYEKEFPAGKFILTRKFIYDKFGFYKCSVKAPNNLNIPFLHTYKDGKLIFCLGSFKGTYTSIEIEKALSLGYKITIDYGYYFTEKVKPFKDYVSKWYKLKQEAEDKGNSALRFISKLYLNTLYGKFGQRRTFRKIINKEQPIKYYLNNGFNIKDYNEDLNILITEEESKSKYTMVHIASFTTAYARIKLYEKFEEVISKGGEIFYCDTDSIITNIELEIGKKLGDLDLENEIKEGIFLFPKFYSIRLYDNSVISKHKGLNNNYDFSEYEKILYHNDLTSFYEEKESIASILECNTRNLKHLSIIKKHRSLRGVFDKRILIDKINTKPIHL